MFRTLRLLAGVAVAGATAAAQAQTMYRCGSAYQDHPCGGGQQGTVIGASPGTDGASASRSSPAASGRCVQRGIAAQKIKWKREAGETQQEQVDAARGNQELIADVYGRQGTSMQIRAAVEQDCVGEQERAAQAAALNKLQPRDGWLELPRGNDGPGAAPGAAPAAAPQSTDANSRSNDAANKRAACQGLTRQLDDVRARQRTGNTLQGMEALRQQYRDIGDKIHAAGC